VTPAGRESKIQITRPTGCGTEAYTDVATGEDAGAVRYKERVHGAMSK